MNKQIHKDKNHTNKRTSDRLKFHIHVQETKHSLVNLQILHFLNKVKILTLLDSCTSTHTTQLKITLSLLFPLQHA